MKDASTKERFIELRAEGRSYERIAEEIGVSKKTLIAWSNQLKGEIANLTAVRHEALAEQILVAKSRRLQLLNAAFDRIQTELEKRDLSSVPTGKIFELFLRLEARLKAEECPTTFRYFDSSPDYMLEEKEISWVG